VVELVLNFQQLGSRCACCPQLLTAEVVTLLPGFLQEAEGSDEDIDRAIQRAMQRAIAAEAALAAAVVAGEVGLTAVNNDDEDVQVEVADDEADDQAEGARGSRAGVGTRRSAPRTDDDDNEVSCAYLMCLVGLLCLPDPAIPAVTVDAQQ